MAQESRRRSYAERREDGLKAIDEMLSPEFRAFMENHADNGGFCSEISEIAIDNIFGQLWSRPGLDRRARSILTIGILIGQRFANELQEHFSIALKHDVTVEEIEEIIYHASGYAGFPASNVARKAAIAALKEAGLA